MNKKHLALYLGGVGALALVSYFIRRDFKRLSRSPLENTIKRIMDQSLDRDTFRILNEFRERLGRLRLENALDESQRYLDGKMPIGNLGPGNYTQTYRDLRIEDDGSVYLMFK